VSSHIRAAVLPCFAHQMLARATAMSDLSDHLVCKVPAPVSPMRVPHPGQGHLSYQDRSSPDGLMLWSPWRPKVLIIFPSLMQEWRGDYVGMVLYLDDQHGILRLQVAAVRA
jgi:hypothetical protein